MIPSVFLTTNANTIIKPDHPRDLNNKEPTAESPRLDSIYFTTNKNFITSPNAYKKPQSAPASSKRRWTVQESDNDNNDENDDDENDNGDGRKFGKWGKIFVQTAFGHAPQHIGKVEIKPKCLMIVVDIFHSILLSVSNTVFVSNPLSGAIILTTMLFHSEEAEKAAILGIISLVFGILSSIFVLHIPLHLVIGGSITFNCFLLGSSLLLLDVEETVSWHALIPLAGVLGVFVVYLWSGLNGILSQVNLPVLNAPTNILALLLFYSGYFTQQGKESESIISIGNNDETALTYNCSIINQIWSGTILSQGIIFHILDIPTSYIIYFCVLIYSPILCFQEMLGGLIGTLIGIGFEGPCGSDIRNGIWGYNSLLVSGAISCFIRFNLHSFILSVIGAVLSAFLFAVFKNNGILILGIPFMICTWLLLPLATSTPENLDSENSTTSNLSCMDLERVLEFSTPELNSICRLKISSRKTKYTPHRKSPILYI